MNEKTILLKISQIMIDPALSTRPIDPDWVRHLEEAVQLGRELRPVLVTKMGEHYVLLGGDHRLEAWKRSYRGTDGAVRCIVADVKGGEFKEMRRLSLLDNRDNAKPFTDAQRLDWYFRLTKEEGWKPGEALDVLNLSDERIKKIVEGREERERKNGSGAGSHPNCESEPEYQNQSEPLSEPTTERHPRASSEPPPPSHPTIESALPSPDDNSILSHVMALCARKGYQANQYTRQALSRLQTWIEEALS